MSLLRAAATVGGLTLISRVLGFARDVLIAAALGAGPLADAFVVAFKIPNFLRRLFAEGAFSAAFVPIFSRLKAGDGLAEARRFAEDALAVLVVALLALVAVVEVAMPLVITVFAPGFVDDPAKFDQAVALTRVTFPYILFISLVALAGGVLNSLERFAAFAAAPVILNLSLIGGSLLAAGFGWAPAATLAWAVLIGGMAQAVGIMVAAARAGVGLRLPRPRLTPSVRRLLVVAAPAAIGAGVYQINVLVDTVIASLLPDGTVSSLYYADRLVQLPLGVVGIAVATALLPLLSRQIKQGRDAEARDSLNRAIETTLLLTLPAVAGLWVLTEPIVVTLFERGAFDAAASTRTAEIVAAFALGLPAFVLAKVMAPGFFAREDTATPTRFAAVALVSNIVLNLALMGPLAHVGIALATSLSTWLNVALLARRLSRDGLLVVDARLKRRLPRIVLASAGMAALLAAASTALPAFVTLGDGARVGLLGALVALGLGGYGGLVVVSGAARRAELAALVRRRAKAPSDSASSAPARCDARR